MKNARSSCRTSLYARGVFGSWARGVFRPPYTCSQTCAAVEEEGILVSPCRTHRAHRRCTVENNLAMQSDRLLGREREQKEATRCAARCAGCWRWLVCSALGHDCIEDGTDDEVGFSSAHGWTCVLARAQIRPCDRPCDRPTRGFVPAIGRHIVLEGMIVSR